MPAGSCKGKTGNSGIIMNNKNKIQNCPVLISLKRRKKTLIHSLLTGFFKWSVRSPSALGNKTSRTMALQHYWCTRKLISWLGSQSHCGKWVPESVTNTFLPQKLRCTLHSMKMARSKRQDAGVSKIPIKPIYVTLNLGSGVQWICAKLDSFCSLQKQYVLIIMFK